jgi:hypothetical protein
MRAAEAIRMWQDWDKIDDRFYRHIDELVAVGPFVMERRNKNLWRSRGPHMDKTMLSVRYPASSRAVIRGGEALYAYEKATTRKSSERLLTSFGMDNLPEPPKTRKSAPTKDKTLYLWENLKANLETPLSFEEMSTHNILIMLITKGAVANDLMDVINELHETIYNSNQPPETRLAYLLYLPMEEKFTLNWQLAIAYETEPVLSVLKRELGKKNISKLGKIIPDLLDLLS